jgi:hypothetical protein
MLQKAKTFVARTMLARGSASKGVSSVKSVARRNALSATPLALAFILATSNAEATPAFARQTGKACSFCHSGPPRLNDAGVAFKNNGFLLPDSNKAPDRVPKDAPHQ